MNDASNLLICEIGWSTWTRSVSPCPQSPPAPSPPFILPAIAESDPNRSAHQLEGAFSTCHLLRRHRSSACCPTRALHLEQRYDLGVLKPLLMESTNTPELASKSSKDEPEFDPSRMIGIIKRKALIKELAAAYHAECLEYCQKILQLQRKWEELADGRGCETLCIHLTCVISCEQQYIKRKAPPEPSKQKRKSSKRSKKGL